MRASTLLKSTGINPDKPVLLITYEEAMENLLGVIEEYCPDLEVKNMTKEDILALLNSYASCVSMYHPENAHQERGALIEHFEMLKRYGLTDDDYDSINFC